MTKVLIAHIESFDNKISYSCQGCTWWTWYSQVVEDEVTKDNVCFALKNCELVAQKCEHCVSGKKVRFV